MLQQLSVFVENKIGSLNKVTHAIYENGINLRAISAFDSPDFCILRIVVEQPEEAKKILTKKGFAVKVSEVLAIELEDQPGELDRVLGILADSGLSINYIYSLVLRGEKAPLMVLSLNDNEKAIQVLRSNNICIVD
ncbi:MAG: ACT domain-containing protein [Clostridiales bacterium]|nr:ACT domain-containing protein [Clostridiales bacterium]